MIIIDFSAIFHMNLNQNHKISGHDELDVPLLRHMVLNSIRVAIVKNADYKEEIVIACDSRENWRKNIFPRYKAERKKDREESERNWDEIFECLNGITNHLAIYFPYKVIRVDNAEADDIIAHLTNFHSKYKKVVIVSPDKDLRQLQTNDNVAIYDPRKKVHVIADNPIADVHEQILKGDMSDGIPNFLSPDNSIVDGIRQKSISRSTIKWARELKPHDFFHAVNKKFPNSYLTRNYNCIHFSCIPYEIVLEINKHYDANRNKTTNRIEEYFMKYELKQLSDKIGDFT